MFGIVRIFAADCIDGPDHEVQVLFFRLQGRIASLPEGNSVDEYGNFRDAGLIMTYRFDYGIKAFPDCFAVFFFIIRCKKGESSHFPEIGRCCFFNIGALFLRGNGNLVTR